MPLAEVFVRFRLFQSRFAALLIRRLRPVGALLGPTLSMPSPSGGLPQWVLFVAVASVGCRQVEDRAPLVQAAVQPENDGSQGERMPPAPRTVVVPDFAAVADQLKPSVVSVISTVPREGAKSGKIHGLGSGMIVSVDGQVLTNAHVVAGATNVDVELASGQRVAAKVRVSEPYVDLALLELEGEFQLQPVEFGQRSPTPGEWMMAVGQPFGLGHTVTVGVVGGLDRDYDDLGRPSGLPKDGLWNFIQTDASINHGNSGGPLVSADSRVTGITTAVRSDGQGLAFAIPAPMVLHFLSEARTYGRVRRVKLGVNAENTTGPERRQVVRVTSVEAEGPGARAGLEVDDFILAIDGRSVDRVSDVAYLAQLRGVGTPITFSIQRGSNAVSEVEIVPDER